MYEVIIQIEKIPFHSQINKVQSSCIKRPPKGSMGSGLGWSLNRGSLLIQFGCLCPEHSPGLTAVTITEACC